MNLMKKNEKKTTPNTKRSFTLRCTIFPAIRSVRVVFFIYFNIVVVSVTVPPFHYVCFIFSFFYEARVFSSSDFLFALLPFSFPDRVTSIETMFFYIFLKLIHIQLRFLGIFYYFMELWITFIGNETPPN